MNASEVAQWHVDIFVRFCRRQNSGSKPPSGVTKPRVTMSRIKENQITAAKMKKLQNQIKLLRLKDSVNTEVSEPVVWKSDSGKSC